MYDKAVDTHLSTKKSVAEYYKNQEMCNRFVFEDYFLIVYCPDKYKTQRICDEAIFGCFASG